MISDVFAELAFYLQMSVIFYLLSAHKYTNGTKTILKIENVKTKSLLWEFSEELVKSFIP